MNNGTADWGECLRLAIKEHEGVVAVWSRIRDDMLRRAQDAERVAIDAYVQCEATYAPGAPIGGPQDPSMIAHACGKSAADAYGDLHNAVENYHRARMLLANARRALVEHTARTRSDSPREEKVHT